MLSLALDGKLALADASDGRMANRVEGDVQRKALF